MYWQTNRGAIPLGSWGPSLHKIYNRYASIIAEVGLKYCKANGAPEQYSIRCCFTNFPHFIWIVTILTAAQFLFLHLLLTVLLLRLFFFLLCMIFLNKYQNFQQILVVISFKGYFFKLETLKFRIFYKLIFKKNSSKCSKVKKMKRLI